MIVRPSSSGSIAGLAKGRVGVVGIDAGNPLHEVEVLRRAHHAVRDHREAFDDDIVDRLLGQKAEEGGRASGGVVIAAQGLWWRPRPDAAQAR